jgi:hypothetical protein
MVLLLDAIFSDCCFGRSQRRIGDKTAHTSTFDFGGLIDQFTFIVGEVDESFSSEAWCRSPTGCAGRFLRHNQMVSLNSRLAANSTGSVWKRPTERAYPTPLAGRRRLPEHEAALAVNRDLISLGRFTHMQRLAQPPPEHLEFHRFRWIGYEANKLSCRRHELLAHPGD